MVVSHALEREYFAMFSELREGSGAHGLLTHSCYETKRL